VRTNFTLNKESDYINQHKTNFTLNSTMKATIMKVKH